jgi:fumarate reductase subunit D
MKRLDQGLGAIGLLALAAILAVFLVTALPVVKSDPPAHTSDWLGFAGSIVGGLMTLLAAIVAWVAVQRQIHAQMLIADGQAAIQSYNIVRDHIKALESDAQLTGEIELRANYTLSSLEYLRSQTPILRWKVIGAKDYLDKERDALAGAKHNFEVASENKASFPNGGVQRRMVLMQCVEFQGEIIELIGSIKLAMAKTSEEGPIDPADEASFRSNILPEKFQALKSSCLAAGDAPPNPRPRAPAGLLGRQGF